MMQQLSSKFVTFSDIVSDSHCECTFNFTSLTNLFNRKIFISSHNAP